jgi:eukaryotic-like serine/threonine-protein kinase
MKRTAKDIFLDALDIADPGERAAFIGREAAGDVSLREAVVGLLAAHEGSPTLSPPMVDSSLSGPPAASARSLAEASAGDVIDGRFTLVKRLGEGGFGVVWLARQNQPVVRDVALKLLRGGGLGSAQVVARFEAERQTLARMDHPHIARVYDAGTTDAGLPYFAMEYVDGQPITNYSADESLSLSRRLELLRQVCLAVQHAHQKGVIHRDLKPGNILVATVDGQAVPKVIDFGIAKAVADDDDESVKPSLTLEAQVIGTPQYMSPEQATIGPKSVDTRSDVYSLGTVLYELITGSPPFDPQELRRAGLEQICRIVRERTPSKPSTRLSEANISKRSEVSTEPASTVTSTRTLDASRLRKQVAGEVDWIVMKALEKEPARRYQTAEGLAADISRYLNHEPVEAGPPSALYAFRKFVRRHRLEVAAAAVVALALVAIAVVSTYQSQQARRAEKVAEVARADAERSAAGERDAKLAAQQSEQLAIKRADDAARELSKVNAIADFCETMLSGLGAGVAQGRDTVLVKEMLEKAQKNADARIVNDPELSLIIRGLIGNALYDLGDYQKAIDLLRPQWESSRSSDTRDGYERLSIGMKLGALYNETGQWKLANEVFREVVDAYDRLNDSSSNLALQAQSGLGESLSHLGKPEEAIAIYRKTLDRSRELGRGDSEQAFQVWNGLAMELVNSDRRAEAKAEWEALLAAEIKKLGETHPGTLATMANLASILSEDGDLEKAVDYSRRVVDGGRKIFEPNHPMRVAPMLNYITDLTKLERYDEAEPIVNEALGIVKANGAAVGWSNSAFIHNVAMKLCASRKDFAGAVDHATAMRDVYAKQFGDADWHTLAGETIRLEALFDAGRFAEMHALFARLGDDPWPAGAMKDYRQGWHAIRARLALVEGRDADARREVEIGRTFAEKRGDGWVMTRRLRDALAAVNERTSAINAATMPSTAPSPSPATTSAPASPTTRSAGKN